MSVLVSFVMATRNDDPSFLAQAIESIKAQTYTDWELVVADDSDRKDTIRVLDSYAAELGESRFRLLRSGRPLGLPRSINRALAAARGQLFARMDGDDLCLPDRLEAQVAYLMEHPDVGIVGSDIEIVDADLRHLSTRQYLKSERDIVRLSFIRNPLAQPTVMIRRSVLDRIGPYDEKCERAEDYELWLRAIRKSVKLANMDRVLLKYRVSEVYSNKRDKRNWKYGLYGKVKNFNARHPLYSLVGIAMSFVFLIAPGRLIDRLYRWDHASPLLYKGKRKKEDEA
jgi:glycosyltransferase involved in cell wall biosynthesis